MCGSKVVVVNFYSVLGAYTIVMLKWLLAGIAPLIPKGKASSKHQLAHKHLVESGFQHITGRHLVTEFSMPDKMSQAST